MARTGQSEDGLAFPATREMLSGITNTEEKIVSDAPKSIVQYTVILTSGEVGLINSLELFGRPIESYMGRGVVIRDKNNANIKYEGLLAEILSKDILFLHEPHKIWAGIAVNLLVCMFFIIPAGVIANELPSALRAAIYFTFIFYIIFLAFQHGSTKSALLLRSGSDWTKACSQLK